MWIPAIGFIVYFAIKNDIYGTKKRNLGISSSIFITSLIIFLMMGCSSTDSITSIQADWQKNTFDISETTEVEITVLPSDADIDSLQLSENNIAKLNYTDGKSIITFTKTGQASLFFTANDDIDSNVVKITVLDKAEEEAKLKAEEEARLKAEQEAQAAAIAAEQERIAQEQAAAQAATQQAVAATVWLSATGSKYHSIPDCGNMNPNNAWQVSLTDAQSMGYEACKKCH